MQHRAGVLGKKLLTFEFNRLFDLRSRPGTCCCLADKTFLGLGQHQGAQGSQSVWVQVWCWFVLDMGQHAVLQVVVNPTGLLQTKINSDI